MVPTLLTHPENNKDFGWELALDLIAWVREFLRGQVWSRSRLLPKRNVERKEPAPKQRSGGSPVPLTTTPDCC